MTWLTGAVAGLCLFGGTDQGGSYAAPMHENDAAQVARIVTERFHEEFPAAATEILLVPTDGCAKGDTFSPAITRELRSAGFALASSRELSPQSHVVRYQLTNDPKRGVFLRLFINDTETAQYFARRADGLLAVGGPITQRRAHR